MMNITGVKKVVKTCCTKLFFTLFFSVFSSMAEKVFLFKYTKMQTNNIVALQPSKEPIWKSISYIVQKAS